MFMLPQCFTAAMCDYFIDVEFYCEIITLKQNVSCLIYQHKIVIDHEYFVTLMHFTFYTQVVIHSFKQKIKNAGIGIRKDPVLFIIFLLKMPHWNHNFSLRMLQNGPFKFWRSLKMAHSQNFNPNLLYVWYKYDKYSKKEF